MALVVEDGSGLVNSNSYLSTAEFQTILEGVGLWAAISDASVDDQEASLQRMTMLIDSRWASHWIGVRQSSTQALYWPRGSAYRDGYLIDHDVIPNELKRALAILSHRDLSTAASGGVSLDLSTQGEISSVKVGPIAVQWQEGFGSPKAVSFVDTLLAGLVGRPSPGSGDDGLATVSSIRRA